MTAAEPRLRRLVRRGDFLRVARAGRKCATAGMVVQACPATQIDDVDIGLGLTASRRVGGAVVRNRARRRLRALAKEMLPRHAEPCYDYVLIARASTVTRPFDALRGDLEQALKRLKLYRHDETGGTRSA